MVGSGGAPRADLRAVDSAGPADDQRHTDAAIVEPSLSVPVRKIGRGQFPFIAKPARRKTAMIRRYDDDGMVFDAGLAQLRNNPANVGIDAFDHA